MKEIISYANIFIFLFLINLTLYAEPVKFRSEIPGKGFKFSSSNTMKMNIEMTMKLDGKEFGKFKYINDKNIKKDILVLESDNLDVLKIEVTYTTASEKKIESDEEKIINIPVSGKTYIIEKTNNDLNITNSVGEIPSAEELNYIKNDYIERNLYQNVSELKDKSYNINDKIPLLESIFKSALGESFPSNSTNNKISIILKNTAKFNEMNCAVFDINLILNVPFENNFIMVMKLKGEIIISTEKLWLIKYNLTGPVTVTGETVYDEGKLTLTGSGQEDWSVDISF